MKKAILLLCLLLVSFQLGFTVSRSKRAAAKQQIIAPLSDSSQLKALTLDNGMKVLLISNPTATLAGVAIETGVGSLSDFDYMPGTAHFIEHTIVMGSKNFPGENDFYDFIAINGGISNAFTTSEVTDVNYQVNSDALDKSLKMLADMYKYPLFVPTVCQLECFAIESEFQLAYNSPSFRIEGVLKAMYDKTHPAAKFTVGNYKTLVEDVMKSGRNFSEELLKFHAKYYSPHLMNMVILSNETIDKMESMVKNYFVSLERKQDLPEKLYEQLPKPMNQNLKSYGQMLLDAPVDILTIVFQLSPAKKNMKTNPIRFLQYLLESSGPGSLDEYLQSTGLVLSFQASVFEQTSFHTTLLFYMQVRKEAMHRSEFIVRTILDYIAFLKDNAINEGVYQAYAEAKKLSFDYSNAQSAEPMDQASDIAKHISAFGMEYAFTDGKLLQQFDADILRRTFDEINTDNMVMLFSSGDFVADPKIRSAMQDVRTVADPVERVLADQLHLTKVQKREAKSEKVHSREDKKQGFRGPYYGTPAPAPSPYGYGYPGYPAYPSYPASNPGTLTFYPVDQYLPNYNTTFTYHALPQEFFDRINDPNARSVDYMMFGTPSFILPNTGKYLAGDTNIICSSSDPAVCQKEYLNDADNKLQSYDLDGHSKFWYHLDRSYLVPRAVVGLVLRSPDALSNVQNYAAFSVFCSQMSSIPDMFLGSLIAGGYQFDIKCTRGTLTIMIEGFSDKMDDAVSALAQAFQSLSLHKQDFDSFTLQAAASAYYDDMLEPRDRCEVILDTLYYHTYFGETLGNFILNLAYGDYIRRYGSSLKPFNYEGVAIGNIRLDEAQRYLQQLVSGLNLQFVDKSQIPEDNVRFLNGTYVAYREWSANPDANDNAIINFYQIGLKSRQNQALLKLLDSTLRNEAFDELRNIKQLGYIVHSRVITNRNAVGFTVEIQGPVKDPLQLDKEIELFIEHFYNYLVNLPDEDFEDMKDAYISRIEAKLPTLIDKASQYLSQMMTENDNFNSFDELAVAALDLTKTEAANIFRLALKEAANKVSIQVWAKNGQDHMNSEGLQVSDSFAKKPEVVVIGSVDKLIQSFQ